MEGTRFWVGLGSRSNPHRQRSLVCKLSEKQCNPEVSSNPERSPSKCQNDVPLSNLEVKSFPESTTATRQSLGLIQNILAK